MAHKSRIAITVIDCQVDDLAEPLRFWSDALGMEGEIDPDGRYAWLSGYGGGYPGVLLQRVEHTPRVHLDIETDDQEAEVARLKGVGAKEVARIKSWIVMEAPTGHRFCIIRPRPGEGMPADAKEFG
ncbi:MAG: VOC family protein [Pseudomonadota bacterium]